MPDTPLNILLVEDDASVRQAVGSVLRDEGYAVQTAADGQEAIAGFKPDTDLVIADLMMPHVDGRALLKWVIQNHPQTNVILMTGFGTIPQAVEAIKAGAAAYLTKPLDPDELLLQVKKILEDRRLRQELSRLKAQLKEGWHYRHIIGQSPAMRQVFAMIDRAAPVKATVLIIGESGTGKEMVARALHESGPRKSNPFLARGYFQAASGGTLLLDEIGELPLAMQSKLLRVLEDGAVTPVGTTTPQKVDVRIIAATNRDLEAQAKEGKFRQDLFFRLNVVKIELPPLRKRKEDLPILTRFFLDDICRQNNIEPREVDSSLLEAFAKYDWPGNMRELRNVLESLVVLSGQKILSADDLPERFWKSIEPTGVSDEPDEENENELNLDKLSRAAIVKALEACGNNRTEAARQLGISRRTLHRRLNEFGLRD
jgi:DNA-binding NtrC family response regulator